MKFKEMKFKDRVEWFMTILVFWPIWVIDQSPLRGRWTLERMATWAMIFTTMLYVLGSIWFIGLLM